MEKSSITVTLILTLVHDLVDRSLAWKTAYLAINLRINCYRPLSSLGFRIHVECGKHDKRVTELQSFLRRDTTLFLFLFFFSLSFFFIFLFIFFLVFSVVVLDISWNRFISSRSLEKYLTKCSCFITILVILWRFLE